MPSEPDTGPHPRTRRTIVAILVWLGCATAVLIGRFSGGVGPNVGGALWFSSSFALLAIVSGRFRPLSALIVIVYGLSFIIWGFPLLLFLDSLCDKWFGEPTTMVGRRLAGMVFPATTAIPTVLLLRWATRSWRPAMGMVAGTLMGAIPLSFTWALIFAEAPWCLCVSASLVSLVLWPPREFGTGHCQRCGYDLSGLKTALCPECGQVDLQPRL